MIPDKLKFIDTLVFGHLRQMPEFVGDLGKLEEWLKQKNSCN
jgi:hypothetical protein